MLQPQKLKEKMKRNTSKKSYLASDRMFTFMLAEYVAKMSKNEIEISKQIVISRKLNNVARIEEKMVVWLENEPGSIEINDNAMNISPEFDPRNVNFYSLTGSLKGNILGLVRQ